MERRESKETEAKRLRQDVEWALESALAPSDVLPLLHRLARTAKSGSEESAFAHRQLAEFLVEREPWRATLHARNVLAISPDDERAWAALALSQTLLGNYRYAANAYARALRAAPKILGTRIIWGICSMSRSTARKRPSSFCVPHSRGRNGVRHRTPRLQRHSFMRWLVRDRLTKRSVFSHRRRSAAAHASTLPNTQR